MKSNKKIIVKNIFLPVILLVVASVNALAGVLPRPSTPTPVVDEAGIFSAAVKQELIDSLMALSDFNGSQVQLVTVKSLDGMEPVEYAYTLGDEWGIGMKGTDNGVVILIKPKTDESPEGKGQVFIATGRGSEGALTDAFCSELVNDVMIPKFKNNDYEGAVKEVLKIIAPILRGEYSREDYLRQKNEEDAVSAWLGSSFCCLWPFVLLLWYFLMRRRRIEPYKLKSYDDINGDDRVVRRSRRSVSSYRSSSSSWSSGSGGGFSYGGGSFGGGGAGGSW